MQVIQTSAPYACCKCGQSYELAGDTDREGDRLPWLVVPEDATVDTVDDAIRQCTCQNCLDFSGPKERGLMVMLQGMGVTVEKSEGGASHPLQQRGLRRTELRKAGVAPIRLKRRGAARSGPGLRLPKPSSPSASVGLRLPTSKPSTPDAIKAGPASGGSVADALSGAALAKAREVQADRGEGRQRPPRRQHRGDTVPLSRRVPEPLRTPVAETPLGAVLKKASERIADAKQARFDERLEALTNMVAALKRTRSHKVLAKLTELAVALEFTCRAGIDIRSDEDVLMFAGAKPGWLGTRFLRYVVRELIDQLRSELRWDFNHMQPVLDLLGVNQWSMRGAIFGKMVENQRAQLEQIREKAASTDVDDLIEELRGWVRYLPMVDDDGRDYEQILSLIGTSEQELERLAVEYYQHVSFDPTGSDSSGGGGVRIVPRETSEPAEGSKCRVSTIEVGDCTINVFVISTNHLPEPNQPLPHVPAGTGAEALPAISKIVYPEGHEYGSEPILVLGDDRHQFMARVRDHDGDGGVSKHPVIGKGQKAAMRQQVGTWPISTSSWVLNPMINDGTFLAIDLVLRDGECEDWQDIRERKLMEVALHCLCAGTGQEGRAVDLINALVEALATSDGIDVSTGPEIELRIEIDDLGHPTMVPTVTNTGEEIHVE